MHVCVRREQFYVRIRFHFEASWDYNFAWSLEFCKIARNLEFDLEVKITAGVD